MTMTPKCGYSMACPFYKMVVGKVTGQESPQHWERNILNLFCHGSEKRDCQRYQLYHHGPSWPDDALLPLPDLETPLDEN